VPAAEGRNQINRIAAAVASKLASGEPVIHCRIRIVFDGPVPERRHPNSPIPNGWRRSAPAISDRRNYVINRGKGAKKPHEMMKRLQKAVLDMQPVS